MMIATTASHVSTGRTQLRGGRRRLERRAAPP